jgi:hypothetical protein
MTKLNPDPKTKLFYGQACLFRWKSGEMMTKIPEGCFFKKG